MPSPFPGMDPYLEDPAYWSGFHTTFNIYIRSAISLLLPEGYFADVEQVVWLEDVADDEREPFAIPDAFIAESGPGAVAVAKRKATRATAQVTLPKLLPKRAPKHVQIVDKVGNKIITVIELLSPSNKESGTERDAFLYKRKEYLRAGTNLVEIDLLRDGERLPLGKPKPPQADYYAIISEAKQYPRAAVWAWTVRDELPVLPIPLKPEHGAVLLELRTCLDRVYEDAMYEKRLNYASSPYLPLRKHDAEWAAEHVKPARKGS